MHWQRRKRHILQRSIRNHHQSLCSQLRQRRRDYHPRQFSGGFLKLLICLPRSVLCRCAGVSSDFTTLRAVSDWYTCCATFSISSRFGKSKVFNEFCVTAHR